jgi:bis(5'-nucleosidyl)-tetraphosphatase
MPQEYSVGIIVYHGDEFLLMKYKAGHWGFTKGKPYTGEPRVDAARREVLEETGLSAIYLVKDFCEHHEYFFRREGKIVHKAVDYFLGEVQEKEVTLSEEHVDYIWLPFQEAMTQLTFPQTRDLLKKANDHITLHG